MSHHSINAQDISDWNSFHDVFSKEFNFPNSYSRNMGAWVRCMCDLDTQGDVICINFENIGVLKTKNREIFDAILNYASLVNTNQVSAGKGKKLALSFFENQLATSLGRNEIKRLIKLGHHKGFLYMTEILAVLPENISDIEDIKNIVELIKDLNIEVK